MRKFDSFLFYIEQTILKVITYIICLFFVIAHYAVVAVGAQTVITVLCFIRLIKLLSCFNFFSNYGVCRKVLNLGQN